MRIRVSFLFLLIFLLSCYNPYKGFKGIDDKGMGKTPPSMKLSKSYERKQKRMERRHRKMMKERRKTLGTPEEKDKERGYSPF